MKTLIETIQFGNYTDLDQDLISYYRLPNGKVEAISELTGCSEIVDSVPSFIGGY